ncbi:MAG: DUF503 domain-containing protein [Candidatus Acetothermia bacterium]|jgi:uncharacterized protein YlxP (DUF503 family)|nr:DUF503 domain-containing protein [Candidatus Acetothermia bacterium]MDH7504947.1 DUF503 domain-containing protein [Candidatus Acetothermia bacterium]
MRVGKILIKLRLPAPQSLKDKRSIVKGLIAKVKREFNVSIAEVGALDDRRRAELGVAIVSNDGELNNRVLVKVVELLSREPEILVEDYELELL